MQNLKNEENINESWKHAKEMQYSQQSMTIALIAVGVQQLCTARWSIRREAPSRGSHRREPWRYQLVVHAVKRSRQPQQPPETYVQLLIEPNDVHDYELIRIRCAHVPARLCSKSD